eukprot:scaffold14396_cov73-Cylindrotheca_fusiformis.AAC.1
MPADKHCSGSCQKSKSKESNYLSLFLHQQCPILLMQKSQDAADPLGSTQPSSQAQILGMTCPEGIDPLIVSQFLSYDTRVGILHKVSEWSSDDSNVVRCALLVTCPTCEVKKNWVCCHPGHRRNEPCFFVEEFLLLKHLQNHHSYTSSHPMSAQVVLLQPPPAERGERHPPSDWDTEDADDDSLGKYLSSDSSGKPSDPADLDFNMVDEDAAADSLLGQYLSYDGSEKPNESCMLFISILRQQHYDYSLAVRSIICICSTRTIGYPEHLVETIDTSSFSAFLNISVISRTLDREDLARLLNVIAYLLPFQNDSKTAETRKQFVFLPNTLREVDRFILSAYNTFSLRNLMPIQNVDSTPDGLHSYTNLVKMMLYTALCPTAADFVVPDRYQSLGMSNKYRSLKNQLLVMDPQIADEGSKNIIVLILIWGDGFDPNRSKTNRGSAWALTATYFFVELSTNHVYQTKTKLIAVGPDKKSNSHFGVFHQLVLDYQPHQPGRDGLVMPISGTSCYHGGGQEISFYPVLLGALFDNPERRSNSGFT